MKIKTSNCIGYIVLCSVLLSGCITTKPHLTDYAPNGCENRGEGWEKRCQISVDGTRESCYCSKVSGLGV